MSAPPYMKLYIGDYLGDTHHLGALEHGAYLMLLMSMWRVGGSLPAADTNLAKLARCTPEEWASVKESVLGFFKHARGRITHKRLAAEMAKYEAVSESRRVAGLMGVAKKANKNNTPAQAIAGHLPVKPEPEPEPEPEPSSGAKAPSTRGAQAEAAPKRRPSRQAPSDWTPSVTVTAVGAAEGFTPGEIERELAKFRDHQFRDARSDWDAAFRNWLRTASERRPRLASTSHDRPDPKFAARHDNYAASFAGAQRATAARARNEGGG